MRHSYAKSLEPGDVITQEPTPLFCVVLYVTPRLAYAGDETLRITCITLFGGIAELKRYKNEGVCILRRGMP